MMRNTLLSPHVCILSTPYVTRYSIRRMPYRQTSIYTGYRVTNDACSMHACGSDGRLQSTLCRTSLSIFSCGMLGITMSILDSRS